MFPWPAAFRPGELTPIACHQSFDDIVDAELFQGSEFLAPKGLRPHDLHQLVKG
jgi:hypothetical protein